MIESKCIFLILARTTPFHLGVFTDDSEVLTVVGAGNQNTNEASTANANLMEPLGTQGFSIGRDLYIARNQKLMS